MGDTKTLAVLTHVLAIFTSFIGPLIILVAVDDKKVKRHARLALNWQFSLLIYSIVSSILVIVLIGALLLPILGILDIVFCIIAAVKASNNQVWVYPLTIPFFKDK